jgi:hypothetical protein
MPLSLLVRLMETKFPKQKARYLSLSRGTFSLIPKEMKG